MTLISAGTAPDADIHEDLEGAELVETFLHPVKDDLLPVLGQFPVLVRHRPHSGVRHAEVLKALGLGTVAPGALPEFKRGRHPIRFRRFVIDICQFRSC